MTGMLGRFATYAAFALEIVTLAEGVPFYAPQLMSR